MKIRFILATVAATMTLVGAANAASVSWTEGKRDQVAGTNVIVPKDASNTPPGFFLGSIRGTETIDLHGRIVKAADFFTFTSKRALLIDFIFGGYDLEAGGSSPVSGLTAVPVGDPGASVNFFLTQGAIVTPSAGNSFNTDITGGDPTIFGVQTAGTYELSVDGLNFDDGLYDIRITALPAVPLPAGGLLLLSALGGLAITRRKRS